MERPKCARILLHLVALATFACAATEVAVPPSPPAVTGDAVEVIAPTGEMRAPPNLARVIVGASGQNLPAISIIQAGVQVSTHTEVLDPGVPECPAPWVHCLALDLREKLTPGGHVEIESGAPLADLWIAELDDDDAPTVQVKQIGCTVELVASEATWAQVIAFPHDGGEIETRSGAGLDVRHAIRLDGLSPGTALAALVDLAGNEIVVTLGEVGTSTCGG
jgi:hypothetical protein